MSHMPLCDGAVVAGDAGPVEHEGHAAPVQRDVHQHLVEGPVEEGRVDRHDRVQAAHRQAGGGGGGVLLGDADVEGALGEAGREPVQADRVHHRGGDRDEVLALRAEADDLVGEDVGPDLALGRSPGRSRRRTGPGEWNWSASCCSARVVAEALAGQRVHDDRPAEPLGLGQRLLHAPTGRGRRPGRRTSGRGPRRAPAGRARPSCPSSSRAARRTPRGRRRGTPLSRVLTRSSTCS